MKTTNGPVCCQRSPNDVWGKVAGLITTSREAINIIAAVSVALSAEVKTHFSERSAVGFAGSNPYLRRFGASGGG